MKRISSFFIACVMLVSAVPVHAATITPGQLIKASGPAVYYYAQDGKRYVFPTEKTYFTWYTDFSSVTTITDAELAAIQIGGNVTYRPGTRLVKITTDPKTYAVGSGRTLRWIRSEAVASASFGANWATQIDDLADTYFVNYTMGADILAASDYDAAALRAANPTIQATLTTPVPAPTPTPTPTPSATVTLTADKSSAQSNEQIYLSAQTTYSGTITRFELYADGTLLNTCSAAVVCSGSWIVPSAGVKGSYLFMARVIRPSDTNLESTLTLPIVSTPYSASIHVTADRLTVKPNQTPNIRSSVEAGLSASKNDIYLDGTGVKSCTSTPYDCRYTDYISGVLGSTHTVYAIVTTPNGLFYKSASIVITLSSNDSPMVDIQPSKPTIFVGEHVDVTITASDDDGIDHTEILKDGVLLKSCVGAAPCTVSTGPWSVPSGTVLTFDGRAYDMLHSTSTAVTTVHVQ